MTAIQDGRVAERRHPRVPIEIDVCTDVADTLEYAVNLSETGLCIQSRKPYSMGSELKLGFQLCPDSPRIEVAAEVIWCSQDGDLPAGMSYYEAGIHFVEITDTQLEIIRVFVDRGHRYCSHETQLDPGPKNRS